MATRAHFPPAMATRWRRRRPCRVACGEADAAALIERVSGAGAVLATDLAVAPGAPVRLLHPDAGAIDAVAVGYRDDRLLVAFAQDRDAVAFALAAIVADMTRAD